MAKYEEVNTHQARGCQTVPTRFGCCKFALALMLHSMHRGMNTDRHELFCQLCNEQVVPVLAQSNESVMEAEVGIGRLKRRYGSNNARFHSLLKLTPSLHLC